MVRPCQPVLNSQTLTGLLKTSLPLRMEGIAHGKNQIVVGHDRFDPIGQGRHSLTTHVPPQDKPPLASTALLAAHPTGVTYVLGQHSWELETAQGETAGAWTLVYS